MTGSDRVNSIVAAVDELRERYFWLTAGPVRWEQLRALLRELGIASMRAPILDGGWVIGQPGAYVIVTRNDLRGRVPTRVILHELGHVLLHMTGEHAAKNLYPCKLGDPREAEAELFGRLLYYGSGATRENNPKIAAAANAIILPKTVKQSSPQITLPLPRVERAPSTRVAPVREPLKPRVRIPYSMVGLGCSHDALLFNWDRGGKPLGYFHGDLGWMDVYDLMAIQEDSRRRVVILKCGDRRAQQRVFVLSTNERRRYVFADGETRSRSPKDLNAQLEKAHRAPANQKTDATGIKKQNVV